MLNEDIGVDVWAGGAAGAGVADWKSSKSSSSAPPDCNVPKSSKADVCFPLPFAGAAGGAGSSNENKSTSGAFFGGGGLAAGGGAPVSR